MTLCLAWKQGDSIDFASDSRLQGQYSLMQFTKGLSM